MGMPYPRVIPHSDGSGTVDRVGEGVSNEWIGRSVWCYCVSCKSHSSDMREENWSLGLRR